MIEALPFTEFGFEIDIVLQRAASTEG